MELALSWEHGSIEQARKGSKPVELPDDLAVILDLWRELSPRDRAALRMMAERLAGR